MINIYDGNAVMLRALNSAPLPGQARITIRQRLASAQASDIWVWDGFDHNSRRQELYPPYKAKRTPPAENIFAQVQLFKKLLEHTPVTQITADRWEADDCVYSVVKRMTGWVTVHTSDADYYQLGRMPHVKLNCSTKPPCEARWTCLYKALCGDSSDNISGIPGFGPKAWEKTEGYRDDIVLAIVKGDYLALADMPAFSKSHLTWLQVNMETLQNMFLITHMWEVPLEEINAGISVGTPNPQLIDETLKKYFL